MSIIDQSLPLVYDLNQTELLNLIIEWGEPKYRSQQIWQGLYKQLWNHPNQFSNIPLPLRSRLADKLLFSALEPINTQHSFDHETTKTLFRLPDQQVVEAVLMHYERRNTLCISSQAGCAMGCIFCATGQMGFKRHLSSGEIIEQVLYYARLLHSQGEVVTNVVIMGMGEPFHNYQATMQAIDQLNDPLGFGMGERRFTISTVGLVPQILEFAKAKRQINLAISLHAANDELRSQLLPINRKYPLSALLDACRQYIDQTRRRITFEWALIQDVNDSPFHAQELVSLLDGLLCHVNVIQLNPTAKYAGKATNHQRAEAFKSVLTKSGIPCSIRIRRGIDIQAGCGQLAAESNSV